MIFPTQCSGGGGGGGSGITTASAPIVITGSNAALKYDSSLFLNGTDLGTTIFHTTFFGESMGGVQSFNTNDVLPIVTTIPLNNGSRYSYSAGAILLPAPGAYAVSVIVRPTVDCAVGLFHGSTMLTAGSGLGSVSLQYAGFLTMGLTVRALTPATIDMNFSNIMVMRLG